MSDASPDAASLVSVSERDDGISVVEFTQGRILDEANIAEVESTIVDVIESQDRPRMLLDFGRVDHLSSAALGSLIKANNLIRDKNGELRLCDIKRQILEVFAITKLDKLFKIYPDRDAALKSFTAVRTGGMAN